MTHTHSHNDHSHAPANFNKAFVVGIVLNTAYVLFEAIFGFIAHSLALVADAGHNLSDVLGLLLAWGASMMAKSLPTKRKTYGLRGSSILAALFNAVFLLVSVGAIAWEALRRFNNQTEVGARTVIWVSIVGIAINAITALMFASGRKGDLNIRGAFLHMAADAAISAGVVVAGFAIFGDWSALDRPSRESFDLRGDCLGHMGLTARIGESCAARRAERCRSRRSRTLFERITGHRESARPPCLGDEHDGNRADGAFGKTRRPARRSADRSNSARVA